MMKVFSKLKWFDWLFIILTILLVSPMVFYAYGTLIFGGLNFSDEQRKIAFNLTFFWFFVCMLYAILKAAISDLNAF